MGDAICCHLSYLKSICECKLRIEAKIEHFALVTYEVKMQHGDRIRCLLGRCVDRVVKCIHRGSATCVCSVM